MRFITREFTGIPPCLDRTTSPRPRGTGVSKVFVDVVYSSADRAARADFADVNKKGAEQQTINMSCSTTRKMDLEGFRR